MFRDLLRDHDGRVDDRPVSVEVTFPLSGVLRRAGGGDGEMFIVTIPLLAVAVVARLLNRPAFGVIATDLDPRGRSVVVVRESRLTYSAAVGAMQRICGSGPGDA
jgi:hypothetical protein